MLISRFLTTEISENVLQAAKGIGEVNENVARDIADVSQSATALAQKGNEVAASAKELEKVASRLQTMIMQFQIDESNMAKDPIQSTANIPDLMS